MVVVTLLPQLPLGSLLELKPRRLLEVADERRHERGLSSLHQQVQMVRHEAVREDRNVPTFGNEA